MGGYPKPAPRRWSLRFGWAAWMWSLVAGMQGAPVMADGPVPSTSAPGSTSAAPPPVATRKPPAKTRPSLFPEEGAKICSQLCETYGAAVNGTQALERIAENFFVLWHLIGSQSEQGAVELTARQQAFVLQEGQDPVSLAQLVADWSLKRFGSDGVSALMEQIGPLDRTQLPNFRAGLYSQAPLFSPACPFGELGSLGLHQCPLCEKRMIEVPTELQNCVLAYSDRGTKILNIQNPEYGIFLKVLRKNWCLDQHLFNQVNLWVNQAPAALQEKVQGSLTAVKMLNWAIEATEFDVTSLPEGPWAQLVARYWMIGFEPAIRWIGVGNDYVDGLADSHIQCPADGGAPDL